MEKLDHIDIVKYGTSTLTRLDGEAIDYNNIADQGAVIDAHDKGVILVSSGAVGIGKTLGNFDYIEDETIRKQVLAMQGNPHLSIAWDKAIMNKRVLQALSTHRSFQNGGSIRNVAEAIYSTGNACYAVLQLNENDFESDEELRSARNGEFGDNDENAVNIGRVAKTFSEFVRISVGTESGGFKEHKGEGDIISELSLEEITSSFLDAHCGKSSNGGSAKGMRGKMEQGINAINNGVDEFWIFDGKKATDLQKIFNGESAGTKIIKSHNLGEI